MGTVLTMPGAGLAELLSEPFDFVWIDLEHAPLSPSEAQEMIIGIQSVGTLAFVRLPSEGWSHQLTPLIDAGVDGIVAADVRSAEQARNLAQRLRLPPVGTRGFGPRRSGTRNRTNKLQVVQNQTPRLWAQIESPEGVRSAHDIAWVEGVEALVPGCADLSYNLGVPMMLLSSVLHIALGEIREAALDAGVMFGLAGPLLPERGLGEFVVQADILMHGTDARICAAAVDDVASQLRRSPN